MKKFLFSAVALVAFSFAGMANNEVKEVETKEAKKEETVVLRNNCDAFADSWYNYAIGQGYSTQEAHNISLDAYNGCLNYHNENNISLTEAP